MNNPDKQKMKIEWGDNTEEMENLEKRIINEQFTHFNVWRNNTSYQFYSYRYFESS